MKKTEERPSFKSVANAIRTGNKISFFYEGYISYAGQKWVTISMHGLKMFIYQKIRIPEKIR